MNRYHPDPQDHQTPAAGLHLPTMRQGNLPDAPGIPACVRVLKNEIGRAHV